jgi:hypothetical protein
MGINAEAAIAISFLRQNNVVRDQILSLGHPELFVTRHQLEKINDAAKIGLSAEDIKAIASEKICRSFPDQTRIYEYSVDGCLGF